MYVTFGPSDLVSATKIALYIPNKDKDGKEIPTIDHWVSQTRTLFTELFGGSTCSPNNKGMWHCRERGIFIEETTAIVTSIVKMEDVVRNLEIIKGYIQDFLHTTGQEAIGIEFDGDMHFVYQDPAYNSVPVSDPDAYGIYAD